MDSIIVVNCFCSLFIIYLSQHSQMNTELKPCCELLLFFVYHIFVTAFSVDGQSFDQLWIAFVLCLSYICHSDKKILPGYINVVNCFCSLFIIYLSQRNIQTTYKKCSCELLLFFVYHIFVTALQALATISK